MPKKIEYWPNMYTKKDMKQKLKIILQGKLDQATFCVVFSPIIKDEESKVGYFLTDLKTVNIEVVARRTVREPASIY